MELKRLRELLPFAENFDLEKFIVGAVKQRVIQVRLCHRTQSVSFGTNVFVPETAKSADGPQLQVGLQATMYMLLLSLFLIPHHLDATV